MPPMVQDFFITATFSVDGESGCGRESGRPGLFEPLLGRGGAG